MGGSSWSHDVASTLSSGRARMSDDDFRATTFKNSSSIDPLLDPRGVKIRESRDSDAHPESNAIAVFFDVTGSMGGIPLKFTKGKLPGLMKMLLTQAVIPDPQILFGAIGDFHSDRAPLQVAQFESGLEMDQWLTKIFLEGNGGGQNRESYETAMWWLATHTSIDCFEKRGKKGYAFTIGDEGFYDVVDADSVNRHTGETLESDIKIRDVVKMLNEKYEHFHICVRSEGYYDGSHPMWKGLLGERALFLEDADVVCELIASQIAACEGFTTDDIRRGIKSSGLNSGAINVVEKSLVLPSNGGAISARSATVSGGLPAVTGKSGRATRL